MKLKKILTVLTLLLVVSVYAQPKIWYVKVGGDNNKDGSSWNNAKNEDWLNSLTGVNENDIIRLAKGNYTKVNSIPTNLKKLTIEGGFDANPINGQVDPCAQTVFNNNSGTEKKYFHFTNPIDEYKISGIIFENTYISDKTTIASWKNQKRGIFNFDKITIKNKKTIAFDWNEGGNENLVINFNNVTATGNKEKGGFVFHLLGNNKKLTVNFNSLYASKNDGSVIYARGNDTQRDNDFITINVKESIFCDNGSTFGIDNGAAINVSQYVKLNSTKNKYINNRAEWKGGAISLSVIENYYAIGGDDKGPARFKSTDDYFEGNKANKGGAIYYNIDRGKEAIRKNNEPNFIIERAKFTKNWATGNAVFALNKSEGGAIALFGIYEEDMPIIKDSEFFHNQSGNSGGAIALGSYVIGYGDQSPALYSLNNKFFGNLAGNVNGHGGAISYHPEKAAKAPLPNEYNGYHIIIENNDFFGNEAKNIFEVAHGGAIATTKDNKYLRLRIIDSRFKKNRAKNNGGALYIRGGKEVLIENSLFEENDLILSGALNKAPIAAGGKMVVTLKNTKFRKNVNGLIEFDRLSLDSSFKFKVEGGILEENKTKYNESWLEISNNVLYDGNNQPEIIPNKTTTIRPVGGCDGLIPDNCRLVCYNPANESGAGIPVNHGISIVNGKENNDISEWPMNRKSAHTVLESNLKGFIITRVTKSADLNKIATPTDGMIVYDGEAKCLKIYVEDTSDQANNGWKCFKTPTCP